MNTDRRRVLIGAAFGSVAALWGCAGARGTPDFKGDVLMRTLTSGAGGLSPQQAAGGLGALLSLAQSRLGADYAALAKLLPSADKYLDVARSAGLLAPPITDVAGLNSAFMRLKMDSMQAKGLLDTTSGYLTRQGGEPGRNLLARALAV